MPRPRLTENMNWEQMADKVMSESEDTRSRFHKWFLSKEYLGGFFFDSLTYNKIFDIHEGITKHDEDYFIVISGREGSGKSTLAIQIASVLSPNFGLKNICYKPIDLIRGIRYAKKGDVFVLDEGNLFLFSRESMSTDNKFMLKLFALMRQKNLCLIICVPNFFTIDSYVRDHRVNSLINIHRKGSFTNYRDVAIKIISKEGSKHKKIVGIKCPKGEFYSGYHNKFFPRLNDVDEESYKAFKGESFDEFLNELEQQFADRDGGSKLVSIREAQKIAPASTGTYLNLIKEKKLKARKIGQKWYVDRKSLEIGV